VIFINIAIFFKNIKENYRNMRIFRKLLIANFLILAAFSLIGFMAVQITITIYNEQLYKKSVQVLGQFTTGVEKNLKDIEKFSLDTSLDSEIQDQLSKLITSPNDYDEFVGASKLEKKLLLQSLSTKTLSSVSYVNVRGKNFTLGENSGFISSDMMDTLITKAIAAKGGYVYIQPDLNSKYIYSSREILQYANTSLQPLGTLLFSCDLNEIIMENYHVLPDDKTSLCIYSDQKLIYQNNSKLKFSVSSIKGKEQGYSVSSINGKKYFVSFIKSQYPDWTYVSMLPYDTMFKSNIILGYVMVSCFVCLFLLSVYLSYKIARNITKPIEDLTVSMKQAETGNFQNVKAELLNYDRTDEVGYLQKDFLKMIRKINTLIEENYEKQLIIKDTEYKALQSQIEPHFLYNTLSSINWLSRTGKCEEISELVISLGGLLRASISKTAAILIEEEVQLLEYYINIQKVRYQDRAQFSVNIDKNHFQYIVPRMILQPIVENSIKYGVENMLEICNISVESSDEGENIKIVITDNGPGMNEEFLQRLRRFDVETKSTGIGLKNIDDRLKIVFGKKYGLYFDSQTGKGTTVTITIPKRGV